jgi:L-alanine-DL-glutamate epimerase-like enolase superfamily enzyme
MKNFNILELQYGEVDWRSEVVRPLERFVNGSIAVPNTPGLGVTLNEEAIRKHALPL